MPRILAIDRKCEHERPSSVSRHAAGGYAPAHRPFRTVTIYDRTRARGTQPSMYGIDQWDAFDRTYRKLISHRQSNWPTNLRRDRGYRQSGNCPAPAMSVCATILMPGSSNDWPLMSVSRNVRGPAPTDVLSQ